MSVEAQKSVLRKGVAGWIFQRCRELGTSEKTPQLAATLLDVFHRKMPQLGQSDLHSAAVVSLMVAVKVLEPFELYPQYAATLPGVRVDAATLIALEPGFLDITNWSIDLITAEDVIELLYSSLPQEALPLRSQWSSFVSEGYCSSAIRYGPLALALAGAYSLLPSRIPPCLKLCFEWAEVTEETAERIHGEVPTIDDSECQEDSDAGSTYSSSPDIKR